MEENVPMIQKIIFHFARPDDWQAAQASGLCAPAQWRNEGFIHCATAQQVPGVIARHLKGRGRFLKLSLDAESLKSALRYEWSAASADHYPHLYTEIPLASVVALEEMDL